MSKIFKYKHWVIGLFLLLAVAGGLLIPRMNVNYQMASYLSEDAPSTASLRLMEDEFGQLAGLRVMVPNVSEEEALAYKARIRAAEGVTGVVWLDDLTAGGALADISDAMKASYYQDGAALFTVTVEPGRESKAVSAIYEIVGDAGAVSGDAATTASQQSLAMTESVKAICILVPLILALLLLTTESFLEPLLFLAAIGVAVLTNMGLGALSGEVSFITQAVSPILQLAVSLDYAIFLLHRFAICRRETDDLSEAMRRAVRQSAPAIAASAVTTLVGFIALLFMKFRIGPDLGLNLVKGVLLSYLSVTVFLPCLTLALAKWLDKTRHRQLVRAPKKLGGTLVKLRAPALILAALLIVPCFWMQKNVTFLYGMGEPDADSRLGRDTRAVESVFGKSNLICVLVPRGDVQTEKKLCDALSENERVLSVTSYAANVGTLIPPAMLDPELVKNLYSDDYARIVLTTDLPAEGAETFQTVEFARDTAAAYYDEYYVCGESASLYDMKDAVTGDADLVRLIAILGILLSLLLTFRSLSLPVLLLAAIELAIWMGLSAPYLTGSPLAYVGYLIINTVQLGATIDYAILITDGYRENRRGMDAKAAMVKTLNERLIPAATSAAVLSLAGFCLALSSTNALVVELGALLGRGTLLSLAMVAVVLPGVLTLFDRVVEKTTLKPRKRAD